ncbi:MAG: GNAT family N-acetyltransferase [Bacteroidetes bacterium]|nr:MAG: GNAT family N-acetyltransferase [Bacteroidota bacterium]
MQISWQSKPFDSLSPTELYNIMHLRSAVFVVEQNCVFLDLDHRDAQSLHLMAMVDGALAAYARIMPVGLGYTDYCSIGRVATAAFARGKGLGRSLMQQAIEELYGQYGMVPIKIGAQLYLKSFYASFGFVPHGPVYLEDGIDHIPMLKLPSGTLDV